MPYMTDVTLPAEDALGALYRALYARLNNGGDWQNRVYPDNAPAGAAYPYLIISAAGGGNAADSRRPHATFDMLLRIIVSGENAQRQLFTMRQQMAALIHEQGTQDGSDTPLDAGPDWEITTATVGQTLHDPQRYEGVVTIRQSGFTATFTLGKV